MAEYMSVRIMLNEQELFLMNPIINIQKETGYHTKLKVQAIVREESYRQLVTADTKADIQIQCGDPLKTIFWGCVTEIDIQVSIAEGEQYQELYLEAKSFSSFLDRNKKYRSFQNQTALYKDMVEFILKDYEGANYILNSEASGKSLNRFTVQYNETDWEFLKRIASLLHLPLVVSHMTKGAKFTMGAIWKNEAFEIPMKEEEQVQIVHRSIYKSETAAEDYQGEQQYFKWKVERLDIPVFEVGDCVIYKGIKCYVKKSNVVIQNHQITQECYLYGKSGFYVPMEINPFITGLSLPGSVKAVKNNQLQVSLDLDALSENNCWFSYSTFYSTFYCMPEKGDRVNLYFPDQTEGHAFVLNSVRTVPKKSEADSSAQSVSGSGTASGVQAGQNSGGQGRDIQAEERDITPILEMLANPQNGRLINASVTYQDLDQEQFLKEEDPSGNGQGGSQKGGAETFSRPRSAAPPDYDFQTLATNENTKFLCTKGGKMVILDDSNGSVSIVCNDGTFIGLDGSNITIASKNKINFHAAGDISLNAGKTLNISAEEKIQIYCDQSGLEILPEKIGIQSTDVKINE